MGCQAALMISTPGWSLRSRSLNSWRAMLRLRHRLTSRRGLALGGAAGGVRAGLGIVAEPGARDGVQGGVELAVPGSVQPVAGDLPRPGGDRVGPGQCRERGLSAQPPRSVPRQPVRVPVALRVMPCCQCRACQQSSQTASPILTVLPGGPDWSWAWIPT
jgi:hypothetical protein